MIRLIRTEWMKLRTVRSFPALIGLALLLTITRFAMVVASAGRLEAAPLGTAASTRDLMMAAGSGTIVFLVLGILSVSSETRHGTISWSVLAIPDRRRVIGAKAVAIALMGAGYLVAISTVVLAGVAVLLRSRGLGLPAVNSELLAAMAGAMVGLPLYGVIGVGVGALFRHQVPGLLVPLGWLLFVENLLPSFGLSSLFTWLPGGATAALARTDHAGLLPMWAGGVVLFAYALAALAAGTLAIDRRDLT